MGNPFFKSMSNAPQGNMLSQFQNFMNQMKGKDPDAMINEMISSGRVNQSQLNAAQQQAQQLMGQFNGIKNMFGF
ncbi:MAG: hypothetical protein K2J47_08500 [Ruminococcus sp.]|nr:hypothetical protein [Ruminococcus sp.]